MGQATQQLQQQVCHKYGWSVAYRCDTDGYWFADVMVALNDTRCFTSTAAIADPKLGKDDVSRVALQGLQALLEAQDAKPRAELCQVFTQRINVYDSAHIQHSWDYFWQHKPHVVGVDVEGNQQTPPVLVQIACEDYCILEVPVGGTLSANLQRLLKDDSIIKVFCDNRSHKDKVCLGLPLEEGDLTRGPIQDLEPLVAQLLGPVSVQRGLSRIVSLLFPELNVWIEKPRRNSNGKIKGRFANIGRFALIEQGKLPPLRGLWDLSDKEQQYAALDAWCTLHAYRRVCRLLERQRRAGR